MNWQPIDTAPEDRYVLLWRPSWSVARSGRFSAGTWWTNGQPCGSPTHWAELPAPPKATASSEADMEPVLSTGEVGHRLGLNVPSERIKELGFHPAMVTHNGIYWRKRDLSKICFHLGTELVARSFSILNEEGAA